MFLTAAGSTNILFSAVADRTENTSLPEQPKAAVRAGAVLCRQFAPSADDLLLISHFVSYP